MVSLAESEARKGAELILFPELANIGYVTPAFQAIDPEFCVSYVKASEPIPGPTTRLLGEVANNYNAYIVLGISQLHPVIPATLYNSAVLIGPTGGIIGIYHKIHLALHEKNFFHPGNCAEVYHTDLGNIGLSICYDGRFPELTRILALKGAEIICSIWAIPQIGEIVETHALKYRAFTRAQENSNYYLACSRTGREGNTKFIGHSVVAAPRGEILAYCDSDEEQVLTAELTNDRIIRARALLTIFCDRRPELYTQITESQHR